MDGQSTENSPPLLSLQRQTQADSGSAKEPLAGGGWGDRITEEHVLIEEPTTIMAEMRPTPSQRLAHTFTYGSTLLATCWFIGKPVPCTRRGGATAPATFTCVNKALWTSICVLSVSGTVVGT